MKLIEELLLVSKPSWSPLLAGFTAPACSVFISSILISSHSLAQSLSINLTDNLIPAEKEVSSFIELPEFEFGSYDLRLTEPINDIARELQKSGDHSNAVAVFKQALHVTRINHGLYSETQIPLLEDIIESDIALRNWDAVDRHYAYMEHLYRRLYKIDDSRLEIGLQKVSSWHINALNTNLDDKRIEHLQHANRLFRLRLQVAELTLNADDPKVEFLHQNIRICEYRLYLASDIRKEMLRHNKERRGNSFAGSRD